MDGGRDGAKEAWMDGRMDGRTDGQMDGWTDGRTEEVTRHHIYIHLYMECGILSSICRQTRFWAYGKKKELGPSQPPASGVYSRVCRV